ncbi:type II toxin-antitoxin system HicB family antitoxin [Clostridium beijerinckii]|uniref:type II toxin-antitoxin system HicB family antitoxin n=1 Tax=Clostridium beijerinckii TaxID=1520 RepID=UPI0003D3302E|nr:type II toxin-antitoxin system HicB family antitoxin [Clostridium beijerinckii]ALB46229.1 HicB family protein [Clostridium beijerinckii NRRL B-598]
MKKDYYVYPAIFSYANDGISIEFPDLPGCLPCADTTEEAVSNAKEAMGLHLFGMEEDNDPIPEPTPITKIKIESNQVLMLIEVFMPMIREAIQNEAVKKTLTIPRWLNVIAEANKINFSQVLQAALKERLNIKR